MLDRLEVYNFKSYRGLQTIGPFNPFTCIIGPNGAGKSNLMDAISFVLGLRSTSLRSAALKDLIYRSGRRKRKGKDKAEGSDDDGEPDDEEEGEESEADGEDGERKAWVMAVYKDDDGAEWQFQRTISTAGTSDYKLNGKTVSYKKYNDQLEQFNILVKAKNFLVFQGDVEQVASQSPKDLSKLIDQISGSHDLKDEYDQAKAALDKASEQSINQHQRRKGINAEVKQYKEMKKEAERWKKLSREKERAIVKHLVWKLFHVTQKLDTNVETVQEKSEQLVGLRRENEAHEQELSRSRKQVATAQKAVTGAEKKLKRREKDLEEARPELLAIDTRLEHAQKRLSKAEKNAEPIKTDLAAQQKKLDGLKKDQRDVQKAADAHEREVAKKAANEGLHLSEADLAEYRKLRAEAESLRPSERAELNTLNHEQKALAESSTSLKDALEVTESKLEKVLAEEEKLVERHERASEKEKSIKRELTTKKGQKAEYDERKRQTSQTEAELNEKLKQCYEQLQVLGADKQESERDQKLRETLAKLKKTFPGAVKGRVIDLCKPTSNKYSLAITTILGRNIDSVVVDTEKTAIECIEYMRTQRAGQATFIPLETISVKTNLDKFRSFAKGARLAIDVITYDAEVEKAMQFACGNAMVCDTLEVAKHVSYERGQEVKAVTLDGTIIHKSGLITGGLSERSGRQFEQTEYEGLQRRRNELHEKLNEILKTKPKAIVGEQLDADIARLDSELVIARDDLNATNTRLEGLRSESRTLKKDVATRSKALETNEKKLADVRSKVASLDETIAQAEKSTFASFCKKIGVKTIREYEDEQLAGQQKMNEAKLRYETQLARLKHVITFEEKRVAEMRERLDALEKAAEKERESISSLEAEKESKATELAQIEKDVEKLKKEVGKAQEGLEKANEELDEVRKQGSKSNRAIDKVLKDIANCNDEIEKLSSERYAVYRRCKLEEIELPLESGSLDSVPIDEAEADVNPMEVDDDGTQRPAQIKDWGIVVDYEALDDDEANDASDTMEESLLAAVTELQGELDKMTPNLKAIDRLGDSEARFKEIDGEFDAARQEVTKAKDAFSALKKERCTLFNKAYEHISGKIDEIYKDLTRGKGILGGTAYLSLEDSEEPYNEGVKYHAMPPMKRFRDMEQLSGGEKTMAALALLFAIHSYHPSPFFVLDEVDAALDNTNVARIARYVKSLADPTFQFVVISLKSAFYENASALVGIYRDEGSKTLSLDLGRYAQ